MRSSTLSHVLTAVLVVALATAASAAGLLVPRDGSPPIRIRAHRVVADVEDGLARTTIRQTFVNPHQRELEAVYVFPLPEGAALAHVAMETGGKRYEGLLVERKLARRTYDRIVRRREDPALVEQIGRNTFRLSVYPVLPGKPTVVEIAYTQLVPLTGGRYRYVYPLAVTGRAAKTEQDLTVTVRVTSSARIVAMSSPTKEMGVTVVSANEAVASMEKSGAVLDRDVVVETRVAVPEPAIAVKTFKADGRPGTFLAVITPPKMREDQLIPRDVILLLDTSGSMAGEKIEQARLSAIYLVEHLRSVDRVNILLFSSGVIPFATDLVPATVENRKALLAFVEKIEARGGTALGDALQQAMSVPETKGRVRTVVMLTDGRPTIGEDDPVKIVGFAKECAAKGLRIYTFGVGSDVHTGLLRGVASAGRGSAEIFRPGGEIVGRLSRFLDRTAHPVLSDLVIEVDGVVAYDLHPRPLPDVYLGEQIVVTGRYRGSGEATVTASALFGGARKKLVAKAVFRKESGGPGAVRDAYARQKLTFLEEALKIRTGLSDEAYFATLDGGEYGTDGEIVRAIIDLSLECGIQSAYTSFLVLLPEDRARLADRTLAALRDAQSRSPVAQGGVPPLEEEQEPIGDPTIRDIPVSDHNEQDTDDEFDESSDDDIFSDAPFDGVSNGAQIGIGGGAGGTYGGRGSRRNLRAEGGGGTVGAVDLGLEWLKNHQHSDGYWDSDGFEAQCKLNRCGGKGQAHRDPGVTGLAALAFLGTGETHKTGRYRRTVRNALKYLKAIQDAEGCFGPRTHASFLLDHAQAALAMIEAYALTGSPLFKQSAQNAVDFILKSQNPDLGWGRGERALENDVGVTAWMVLALQAAKEAGKLRVEPKAVAAALAWLDKTTDRATGRVGLLPWQTPATMLVRLLGGTNPRTSEAIQKGAELCLKRLPSWKKTEDGLDMGYWFFGTQALFQVGGEPWKAWNVAMKKAIIDHQQKDGDQRGSWDPLGPGADEGGRVRSTALMTLSLEVYYRYRRVISYR
jgi:Ca-activated chloride channel homolog